MRPTPASSRRTSLRAATVRWGGLTALLMIASVGGLRWSLRAAEARSAAVDRDREIIAQTYAVARCASVAQSHRGAFLLGHEPGADAAYHRALQAFHRQFGRLAELMEAEGDSSAQIQRIAELFEGWVEGEAALSPGDPFLEPALREAFLRRVQRMEALQGALDELVASHASAVVVGTRASRDLSATVDLGALLATALVVIAALAAVLTFSRRVATPLAELTASATAIARGELERRVVVRRDDEIGSLAASFNSMAEQLHQQRRQDEALRELRELMHGVQDVGEAERILALLAPECLPGTAGRLHLLDGNGRLVPRGGWAVGAPGLPFPAADCWGFRMGRPHEVSPGRRSVRCAHRGACTRDALCVPLNAGGAVIGMLEVGFDERAPRGIIEIGETLALTMANLRIQAAMREEARIDALTGLYNRGHFERSLAGELERAAARGAPLALAMLDVDHFKRFNDTHGHAAGDAVLRAIAAALRLGCRESDLVFRFGGEEFAVLLPGCGRDAAVRKVEALRQAVRALRIEGAQGPLGPVTLSAGVSAFPDDGAARDPLVAAADQALYRAKAEGRDRVASAHRPEP